MILLTPGNFNAYFVIEKLETGHDLTTFNPHKPDEYTAFLKQKALAYQETHISNTFLLIDRENRHVAAYISLIADAVTLQEDEKEILILPDVSFETLPALKIAKLAVNMDYPPKFHHLGSLMIDFARSIADECNEQHIACRVLTTDADIEYDKNLPVFYGKNGFTPLQNKKYTKKTRTLPMWSDIYPNL